MPRINDFSRLAGKANGVYNSVTTNATAITSISVGGTTINSTIYAATANNANNLGGVAASSYVNTSAAFSFTATHTYSGNSSAAALVATDIVEPITVSATAANGTINYDITTQSVLYYTSNAANNWTVNLRASSGTTLNNFLSTGQAVTVAFLITQGATAYYANNTQVDGANVTPKWQGGSAPTSGNANNVDSYTYTVVKTANATFTVFAAQTKFA